MIVLTAGSTALSRLMRPDQQTREPMKSGVAQEKAAPTQRAARLPQT